MFFKWCSQMLFEYSFLQSANRHLSNHMLQAKSMKNFKKYFQKMWVISYSLFFQIFQVLLSILTGLQFSFNFLQPFLRIRVMLTHFKEDLKIIFCHIGFTENIYIYIYIYINIVQKYCIFIKDFYQNISILYSFTGVELIDFVGKILFSQ